MGEEHVAGISGHFPNPELQNVWFYRRVVLNTDVYGFSVRTSALLAKVGFSSARRLLAATGAKHRDS